MTRSRRGRRRAALVLVGLVGCSSSSQVSAPTTVVAASTSTSIAAPLPTLVPVAPTETTAPVPAEATTAPPAAAGTTGSAVPAYEAHVVDGTGMSKLSRAAGASDGTGVLAAGGLDAAGNSVRSILRFDPATGAVTPAGRLETAVHDAGAAVLNGKLFVFGGGTAKGEQSIVQAGPVGGDAVVVGDLPVKRSDHVVVADGTRALIVGGFDGTTPSLDVLATTDGVTFEVVGHLLTGLRYPAAAVIGAKLYVFGGELSKQAHDDVQVVDLAAGTTTALAPLPAPRSQASAVTLGDAIYVLGGRTAGTVVDSVLRFDPATGTTSVLGALPGPISDTAAGVVGGIAYLVGGERPGRVATVVAVTP